MKPYAFVWDPRAAVEVLQARARLGVVRAATLDAELERARDRLCLLPWSAPRAWLREEWSETIRKLGLSRSPYHLYYAVDVSAEEVVALALRHEKQAEPDL
jgi:plasmid stabilization system protein ParE